MIEQLHKDVKSLTAQGTRRVGTAGHALAREYLTQRLAEIGLKPYSGVDYELPYSVEGNAYTNIAGICPGTDPVLDPILIVAHYDTCGDQPGADDNGAAMAIWLDVIARIKDGNPLQHDIILLFPDAEEPPHFLSQHMGSTNFYNIQLKTPLHCGLVLDLVGHDVPLEGMADLLFIFGAESHPTWEPILLNTELPDALRTIATLNRYVGDLSDHHILRENGVPYLFFTCGRWEHYHKVSDLPENLNYSKMERVSRYLYKLVRNIDNQELGRFHGDIDPIDMELKLLHRAIGPFLESHHISLKDREDMQRFVLNWVREHHL